MFYAVILTAAGAAIIPAPGGDRGFCDALAEAMTKGTDIASHACIESDNPPIVTLETRDGEIQATIERH